MASQPKQSAASWSSGMDASKSQTGVADPTQVVATPRARAWKSRVGWRIAFAAFLTILTVQAGIMTVTVRYYEQTCLDELVEAGRSAIVPLMKENVSSLLGAPITAEEAKRLTTTTRVNGIAIYSRSDLNLLARYGTPTMTSLTSLTHIPANYRSSDGDFYEVVFKPRDLGRPYYIVAQLDSLRIGGEVLAYIEQMLLIMSLTTVFVTAVVMAALGHWLLEPILYLRANLLRAAQDPENPKIGTSPYNHQDEIGGTIDLAQTLIRQNAENIKRIKGAAEDQIHKLAYYDALTALPNRTSFIESLNDQIATMAASRKDASLAVIAVDLDHFKDINDSMGHSVGDALLRAVGKRLRASLPESAIVARSGEDEFAITMPLPSGIKARDVADRVLNVIRSEPFNIFNENFQIRASIGVSTYPVDGTKSDHVLKNADVALNRAKEDGRDTIKEYSEDFDRAVQHRFKMLRDLRDAMEQKQLMLYYQPQLDLRTGAVIGAETLLRWFKKDGSKEGGHFISPAEFVPIAEQSGLIVPIGEMVLRMGCETAAQWARDGYDMRIAVNVSGAQFYQSDLVSYVRQVLADTKLEPHKLELEVTESIFMEDVNQAIETLQELHSMGVELAIDDFGTGYSSLSYLRQFPIDRLKIDQSFIRNALDNPDDASIARTIVRLGHSLNMKVIAEGVESKDHEAFLLAEGCDEVQGYRYSKPVPLDKFYEFLKTYNGELASFSKG